MRMDKKLRKNITISPSTYKKAQEDGAKLGLTFSAYLTFLINKE